MPLYAFVAIAFFFWLLLWFTDSTPACPTYLQMTRPARPENRRPTRVVAGGNQNAMNAGFEVGVGNVGPVLATIVEEAGEVKGSRGE
jgi:hypothetical protein